MAALQLLPRTAQREPQQLALAGGMHWSIQISRDEEKEVRGQLPELAVPIHARVLRNSPAMLGKSLRVLQTLLANRKFRAINNVQNHTLQGKLWPCLGSRVLLYCIQ